jgi:hypothetical protein
MICAAAEFVRVAARLVGLQSDCLQQLDYAPASSRLARRKPVDVQRLAQDILNHHARI